MVETGRLGAAVLFWSIPPAASGIFITFSVNHAPVIGMIGFVILSLGVTLVRAASVLLVARGDDSSTRTWRWINGAVALVSFSAGIAGCVALSQEVSLTLLIFIVAIWAGFVALGDGLMALRLRGQQLGRDMRVVTLATGTLAVVFVGLPLSSVYAVGLLGAYGIVLAVYLAIAGFSMRFDTPGQPNASESRSE